MISGMSRCLSGRRTVRGSSVNLNTGIEPEKKLETQLSISYVAAHSGVAAHPVAVDLARLSGGRVAYISMSYQTQTVTITGWVFGDHYFKFPLLARSAMAVSPCQSNYPDGHAAPSQLA
jgi:hypothetical protein